MMPVYSETSKKKLDKAHPALRAVFGEVITHYDNQILQTDRSLEQQRANVESGASQTMDSKHVLTETRKFAEAADAAPYPVEWPQVPPFLGRLTEMERADLTRYVKTLARFYHFGGFVEGVAALRGVGLRWGGDWDRDHEFRDQSFDDLVHFELAPPRGPF